MRDFSLKSYKILLHALKSANYKFQTFEEYLDHSVQRTTLLRHDVDSWPVNAFQMAEIEAEFDIKATYYFRTSLLSYNEGIIRQIAALGHEIGYHYEDLSTHNGNYNNAIKSFERNLDIFRKFYPVKTIAMHGKPLSRWDNLDLWKKYDFRDYGIVGEPYLSIDFDQVLFLTDTGNCWDGYKYSIRDHVQSNFRFSIHSTYDLIEHLTKNQLPDRIMLNIHPARWNDNPIKWIIRYYILTLPKYEIKKRVKKWRNK